VRSGGGGGGGGSGGGGGGGGGSGRTSPESYIPSPTSGVGVSSPAACQPPVDVTTTATATAAGAADEEGCSHSPGSGPSGGRKVAGAKPRRTKLQDPPQAQETSASARWFDGVPPTSVDPNHMAAPERPPPGAAFPWGGAPGAPPSLPPPPANSGPRPVATATVAIARAECNLLAGLEWGTGGGRDRERRSRSGDGCDAGDSDGAAPAPCDGMRLVIKGAALRADEFPRTGAGAVLAWRAAIAVADAALLDLTPPPRCRWGKILAVDSAVPREDGAATVRAELTAVRPDQDCPDGVELQLRATLLPLHLRLDQHVLKFLQAFFQVGETGPGAEAGSVTADASVDTDTDATMRGNNEGGGEDVAGYDDDMEGGAPAAAAAAAASAAEEEASRAYFQLVEVRATSVRLDYCPRAVDVAALRAGNLAEALNLVPFGGVTLALCPISARGVAGWAALGARVVRTWLEYVSRTQAMKFATGIAPIRSVCNVGAGAAQVISQPLEFRRTGRRGGVWRGASYGAAAFVRAVSCEALGLGVHLAAGATAVMGSIEHLVAVDTSGGGGGGGRGGGSGGDEGLRARADATVAIAVEASGGGSGGSSGSDFTLDSRRQLGDLQPISSSSGGGGGGGGGDRKGSAIGGGSSRTTSRATREAEMALPEPAGLREGFAQAAAAMSRGLGSAAAAIAAGPLRKYREGGVRSAAVSAVRTGPAAVAAPVAAAAAAVHRTLLGARNQLAASSPPSPPSPSPPSPPSPPSRRAGLLGEGDGGGGAIEVDDDADYDVDFEVRGGGAGEDGRDRGR